MTERFILVNGRILDFRVYKAGFSSLHRMVALDLWDYFGSTGFRQVQRSGSSFSGTLKFYNEEFDMELLFTIRKKSRNEFV